MNFKTFGIIVLCLGVFVIGIGALIIVSNPDPRRTGDFFEDMARSDMGHAAGKRADGKGVAVAGIVVALVGVAIMASAKKVTPDQPQQVARSPRTCKSCNTLVGDSSSYCSKCGTALGSDSAA